ncbi:unnamed protein product [Adineta ricciae]|uniref:Uncharacterized protein n=1 Tax=Adineta ricciae TaxID=249248 RepID=A0A814MQH2_ADIRI|nr:unnamed protein product [Adineta ricciae]
MLGLNSDFKRETSEAYPAYGNPEQMFDATHMRFRHNKSNIPTKPAYYALPTVDYHSNVMDHNPQLPSSYTHNKTQIIFLIFTTLVYFLHTLRIYVCENMEIYSHFWSSIKPRSITRIYTSDLRPTSMFEQLLLHSAEICQTLWLIYILSFIVRRTSLGYLYRNPSIFNIKLCCLLISALGLQGISQMSAPPEVSCVCLFLSYILLAISCRLISTKALKYEEKFKSIDSKMIRHFVLNCLFLYTTSIGYITICSSIECLTFHFEEQLSFIRTIGLLIGLLLLIIYFIFDQLVYQEEFQSIWTPYLFLTTVFLSSRLQQFFTTEPEPDPNPDTRNVCLSWTISGMIVLLMSIRIVRLKLRKSRTMKPFLPSTTASMNLAGESLVFNS